MAERGAYGIAVPYLRAWRRYRALSQSELAERSGASRPAIARAETGSHLSLANVRKVAECLGISVQQLLREDPNGASQTGANSNNRENDPTR